MKNMGVLSVVVYSGLCPFNDLHVGFLPTFEYTHIYMQHPKICWELGI